ncbi:MAG: phosphoribosyl-AMP cyclohydrolase [Aestuariivita sp.]|nr:phosphoribosyl-AMP cyclohydrolase [Aestuariivita sp.]MCY4203810.1 phosphoribosyl-AMP cyclohydrolase [Aestuariivita sp.]MCY4288425.1 phosphoribosyl-AMP cyclohydrolase [Aestuariivita sp.]MCY4345888.1 phosphoribosyl-AMP cyclohydrolase [Aestuariivita sp.]
MPFDVTTVKFNSAGLVPCVVQENETGIVLMLAWMSKESISKTLETKRVTFWSRSRQELWIKGETSGHSQELIELRLDCDQDCLLAIVNQTGPACHTGEHSCFFTTISDI